MKFIDFFAGIGGFRKGMEMAGHECVGFCEFDKFATASYISMHLITQEQREYLSKMPLKQRQKEILKEEYRNGEWYANLYGKSSMSILKNGKEVLHTSSRSVNTEKEVMELLEKQPEFMRAMNDSIDLFER